MWHDLSDGAAAIGNHDRLTRRGQSDVFAQLVLQDLKPDRAFEVSSPKKLLCLFAPARGADLAAPVALIDTATTGRYVKRLSFRRFRQGRAVPAHAGEANS